MSDFVEGRLHVEVDGDRMVLKVEAGPASTEIRVPMDGVPALISEMAMAYEEGSDARIPEVQ